LGGLRVLVAGRNPVYMGVVRDVLATIPKVVSATEVTGCREVIAEASSRQPDLALLDVHLADCDGLALARELRKAAPGVKVVLLLSDDGAGYRLAASQIGARCVLKDRLVEDLPLLVQAAEQPNGGWALSEGEVAMDRVSYDVRFGRPQAVPSAAVLVQDSRRSLADAARPALVIFLVGAVLLALTAALAWNYHVPVARDGAGGSRIVDELGLFAEPGAIVTLDRDQADAYISAWQAQRRRDLLLCIAVGGLGLAIGSVLIARLEWKEQVLSGIDRATRDGCQPAS